MGTIQTYEFLDDLREREWLTNLDPESVRSNAHRIYDWMQEQGVDQDSFLRELAFTKASEALGLDYDVFYDAWIAGVALN
jgi:hypothetical protein